MKTEIVLLLYDTLIGGESVSRAEFCAKYGLSERTFFRYMREINLFLRTHRPARVIDYSARRGEYVLVGCAARPR